MQLHLHVLALGTLAFVGGDGQHPAPLDGGAVVAYEIPDRADTRRECFALFFEGDPVGIASSTFRARENGGAGRASAELRFELWQIRTRVHHVESVTPRGPRLVWRELRERSGRTVRVDWSEDGKRLVQVDWSGAEAVRGESTPESGALLPLFLVASVRDGAFPTGRFDVYDAPSGRVEELRVSVLRCPLAGAPGLSMRRLELLRADGTLAGDYLFLGRELVAFRVQEGGPVALRVSTVDYRKREREEEERRKAEIELAGG